MGLYSCSSAGAAAILGVMRGLTEDNRQWTKVGEQKYTTYQQYLALYPEFEMVFFGDNGQGDLLAAERMATHPTGRFR